MIIREEGEEDWEEGEEGGRCRGLTLGEKSVISDSCHSTFVSQIHNLRPYSLPSLWAKID